MNFNYKKLNNLFLSQSYTDAWEDYQRSLRKPSFIKWDFVILTASNEEQACAYRAQLQNRIDRGLLPVQTQYAVLPDPDGKRVGSGGATLNVMKYIAEMSDENDDDYFKNKRILVIHSGGDSKRVPQYSACGKLFSPVPRELPNGNPSTLFDEFIIGMSGFPSRIREGMLVLSGDVLLLFNSLQVDTQFKGAAAISIKEHVSTGKNHGVFLNDGNDYVERFLHKQSEEKLSEMGAVNKQGYVDLDTGAVLMDSELLNALFSLISTNNKLDKNKFEQFVNEKARISFYGDFLYPLAKKSSLEQYLLEAPEGSFCSELEECRKQIWNVISKFNMKLICLSPAEFIHFGTTKELLKLVTEDVSDYEFLDWKKSVSSNCDTQTYAVHNSFVCDTASISDGSYIEDSYVGENTIVGNNTILSNVCVSGEKIPSNIVLHGLKLADGNYVVRVYGINDNPKSMLEKNGLFISGKLTDILSNNNIKINEIWDNEEHYLWTAKFYPVCCDLLQAVSYALILYKISSNQASEEEISSWKKVRRMSLEESFNNADVRAILPWKEKLNDKIVVEKFLNKIKNGIYYEDIYDVFGSNGLSKRRYELIIQAAKSADFNISIRIYYYLSRIMKKERLTFDGISYDQIEKKCFDSIQNEISAGSSVYSQINPCAKISKEEVNIELPVRVNWGGGWTDTPPYCNECGGIVLNAALKLNGDAPVKVTVRKISEYKIEFESQDIGVHDIFEDINELRDCHNPFDSFALHKAALIACGIVSQSDDGKSLEDVLREIGGGIYLSTQVVNVPKGSGLGTSSILAGACVKAIYEFLGYQLKDEDIYDIVLHMEQIMSTGGGWQDQVGGLTTGIKLITSHPGIKQHLKVENLSVTQENMQELNERFALIYTGQRRLARNLLREVVGNYVGNRPESIEALTEMKKTALLMKYELEYGTIDGFAKLLNYHWELSKQLDAGSTNTCIEQIFIVCDDLIDGKFISGAGGGGFLQVILKKDVTRDELQKRLKAVFQDSGVAVWDCELV